jgi:SAM-dependent methyltransferase
MSAARPSISYPDQNDLWNAKHSKNEHIKYRGEPMPFAKTSLEYFPERASILEVACGVGSDASFFAQQGYDVLATDFSQVVVDQDKAYFDQPRLEFAQLDVSRHPLPFPDRQFDVVYSHLGLHYFSDDTTRAVMAELHRILKDGGILAFACKSVKDSSYGVGDEIEKDVFVDKGHLRHFFTPDYVRKLLQDRFDIVLLQDKQEEYGDTRSAFVWCVAKKRMEQ